MTLRREKEDLFRQSLEEMKRQIDDIDVRVEEEIAGVKARLADLQGARKILANAYRGMAKLLGEEAGLEAEETRSVPPSFKVS